MFGDVGVVVIQDSFEVTNEALHVGAGSSCPQRIVVVGDRDGPFEVGGLGKAEEIVGELVSSKDRGEVEPVVRRDEEEEIPQGKRVEKGSFVLEDGAR